LKWLKNKSIFKKGSYHKRQISNPPTPLPPMFKTAIFRIHRRRYQPNLSKPLTLAVMIIGAYADTGGHGVGRFEIWRL